jgi:hypothetical protein
MKGKGRKAGKEVKGRKKESNGRNRLGNSVVLKEREGNDDRANN